MTDHLFHRTEYGRKAVNHGAPEWLDAANHHERGYDAKWQRHVIALLWCLVLVFFALSAALLYVHFLSVFGSVSGNPTGSPAWPTDW